MDHSRIKITLFFLINIFLITQFRVVSAQNYAGPYNRSGMSTEYGGQTMGTYSDGTQWHTSTFGGQTYYTDSQGHRCHTVTYNGISSTSCY